jgi:hypothetical protein
MIGLPIRSTNRGFTELWTCDRMVSCGRDGKVRNDRITNPIYEPRLCRAVDVGQEGHT